MQLTFNLALLVVASASIIRADDAFCDQPLSRLCRSAQVAKRCQVLSECIELHLWTPMRRDEVAQWMTVQSQTAAEKDEVCDICLKMVGQARDQLLSNETQTELLEVLEGSCALLKIDLIVKSCDKLVDQFAVYLVDTLASEMNPSMVCNTAGLCDDGISVDRPEAELADTDIRHILRHTLRPFDSCEACQADADTWLHNVKSVLSNQAKSAELMVQLCKKSAPTSTEAYMCDKRVGQLFPTIYKYLIVFANSVDGEFICSVTKFGQCPRFQASGSQLLARFSQVEPNSIQRMLLTDDLQCEFCEKIVKHWLKEWRSRTTELEFKHALDAMCDKIKLSSRRQRCRTIVDQYYLPWWNFIIHELDPAMVCTAVSLCPSSVRSSDQEERPNETFTSQGSRWITEENEISQHDEADVKPRIPVNPLCDMCSLVNEELSQIPAVVAQTSLEAIPDLELIADSMQSTCQQIGQAEGSAMKIMCDNFVAIFGKGMQMLWTHRRAHQMLSDVDGNCIQLGLCPSSDPAFQPSLSVIMDRQAEIVPPDTRDELDDDDEDMEQQCPYLADYIYQMATDPSDMDEIMRAVESVCSTVPSRLRVKCQAYIDANGDQIVALILDGTSMDELCHTLTPRQVQVADDSLGCTICATLVETLDRMVTDKSNRAEIEDKLELVCTLVPQSYVVECQNLVRQFGDELIDAITKGMTPRQVCEDLSLCDPGTLQSPLGLDDNANTCTLCMLVVSKLDDIIEDKTNEAKIIDALESICLYFPHSMSGQCRQMIDSYGYVVIDYLADGFNPEEVCKMIHVCPTSTDLEANARLELDADIHPCDLCKYIVDVVDQVVEDKQNRESVIAAMNKLCIYLPDPDVRDGCQTMVRQNVEKFVEYIAKHYSPDKVCREIHICPAVAMPLPPLSAIEETIEPQCLTCDAFFDSLRLLMPTGRASEEDIRRHLKQACMYLPNKMKRPCMKMVSQYVNEIVHELMTNWTDRPTPMQMCQDIGLCQQPVDSVARPYQKLCIEIVDRVEEYFADKDITEDKLVTYLDQVCYDLSSPIVNACLRLVKREADWLVDMLKQGDADSRMICRHLPD